MNPDVVIDRASLEKLLECAEFAVAEIGGCDHGVGICECAASAAILAARLVLGKAKLCEDCDRADDFCQTCGGTGVLQVKEEV